MYSGMTPSGCNLIIFLSIRSFRIIMVDIHDIADSHTWTSRQWQIYVHDCRTLKRMV